MYNRDGLVIREARADDIEALANNLRSDDLAEVIAAGAGSAAAALKDSFSRSTHKFTIEHKGVPVGSFGIVPDSLVGASANIWMVGTPGMGKIKKSFVKLSHVIIDGFLTQYGMLWNVVDSRYQKAIRWLLHAGAVFDFQHPVVLSGVPFYRFTLRVRS